MGRALLPGIVAGFGFGLVFGRISPLGPWALGLSGLFLLLASWRRLIPLLWASALFLGMAASRPASLPKYLETQLPLLRECTGTVVDLPEPTAKRLSFTVKLENLGVRLSAYIPQDVSVYPGQRVRLFGQYGFPKPEGYRKHLERQGIFGLFWGEKVEIISETSGGLLFWTAQVRAALHRVLSALPKPSQALLSALLLGSRGLLSPEEREAFRKSGVAHLLALSGLHLGIVVAGGFLLLGLFHVPKTWRYLFLIPLVTFYVLLGGLRVSLLRAALMFGVLGVFWILWGWGWVARSWLDPLQGLSFAALLVLLIWPWSAEDAAFQLSFSATAGIILFLPHWTSSTMRRFLPRVLRFPADILAVSACAQIGVLPFLGSIFGYLAPYGLVANLLLIPWTTVLLWVGILGLPFLALPTTQVWAGQILGGVAQPYLWLVERLGDLPGAVLPVGENFGLWYLSAILALLTLRAAQEDFLAPQEPWPKRSPTWLG